MQGAKKGPKGQKDIKDKGPKGQRKGLLLSFMSFVLLVVLVLLVLSNLTINYLNYTLRLKEGGAAMPLDINLHKLQDAHGNALKAFGLEEQAITLADQLEAGKTIFVYNGRLVTKETTRDAHTPASPKDLQPVIEKIEELRHIADLSSSKKLNRSLQVIKVRASSHDIPQTDSEKQAAQHSSLWGAFVRVMEKFFQ